MDIKVIAGDLVRLMEKIPSTATGSILSASIEDETLVHTARKHTDVPAIATMLEAWDMQVKRERGELHLVDTAARFIWDGAIKQGRELAGLQAARSSAPMKGLVDFKEIAVRHFRRRAASLHKKMTLLPPDAGHSQVLTGVARAEGFSNVQALRAQLTSNVPGYCPCCGAMASLVRTTTGQLSCGQCSSTFSLTEVSTAAAKPGQGHSAVKAQEAKVFDPKLRDALERAGYDVLEGRDTVTADSGDTGFIWASLSSQSRKRFSTAYDAWASALEHAAERVTKSVGISRAQWDGQDREEQCDDIAGLSSLD